MPSAKSQEIGLGFRGRGSLICSPLDSVGVSMTKAETIQDGHGARLERVQLLNGGVVVDTSYLLHSPRSPVAERFSSLSEANAAFVAELNILNP